MAVYVDDMRAPFGRMVMCHMIADSTAELLAMADRIGVARRWIQHPGTPREHFDIALSKRAAAVRLGAAEITWRQCGAMERRRRETGSFGDPESAEAWLSDFVARRIYAAAAPGAEKPPAAVESFKRARGLGGTAVQEGEDHERSTGSGRA